jgi:hypothetical protein
MVFLQTSKIVMVAIQKTQKTGPLASAPPRFRLLFILFLSPGHIDHRCCARPYIYIHRPFLFPVAACADAVVMAMTLGARTGTGL